MGLGPLLADEARPAGGVLVFILSCLVYNLALWGVVQLLNNAGVIGWELRWVEAGPITIIVMLWRVWDRALFRRGEG